jgi:heme/copper-type cytochrome/quinol oxidase subunit 4
VKMSQSSTGAVHRVVVVGAALVLGSYVVGVVWWFVDRFGGSSS